MQRRKGKQQRRRRQQPNEACFLACFDKPIWRPVSLQASGENAMTAFNTITVTRSGQIATITTQSKQRKALTGPHVEIGAALSELRYDNAVRVVIITGDDAFFLPPKGSPKASGHTPG